ncbi:MAG: HAD family hydrolase [ANME-2 cluster archaeon]|nr:HAD family hydrolase [ANME-2 cluster archaeon]
MQSGIAVVFDSAGTLLHMYRVAKNTTTGEYLDDIITTDLVGRHSHCGLVILHTNPDRIMNCNPHNRIYDFIQENKIEIDLSCSSSPLTLDQVRKALELDTRTTMKDLHEVITIMRNKCPDIFYLGVGIIVEVQSNSIAYTVCTGGKPFTNTTASLNTLKQWGVDAFIASGDSMRNLEVLARVMDVPIERVYDVATPLKKKWVIRHLKKHYDKVVMVGDGINDILALREADKGVVSIQQIGACHERLSVEADIIITDIMQILKIIEEMKEQ